MPYTIRVIVTREWRWPLLLTLTVSRSDTNNSKYAYFNILRWFVSTITCIGQVSCVWFISPYIFKLIILFKCNNYLSMISKTETITVYQRNRNTCFGKRYCIQILAWNYGSHGPMHYKIGVNVYTMDTCSLLCCNNMTVLDPPISQFNSPCN